uniref:Choline-specific glycerophosphodiester phosphodiesterase n=1 Tax=Haemonchus contortus TaxID=6289 RepID=A0A7I4Z7U1_HAECO|nr:Type I phosphodiesterase nucleotide pyrophosphatase phosphate transferase domain containing protein [Haemonchus contortus]
MLQSLCALFLVGTIIAKDPIGQNIIVLLIDGYGANLLNESKTEAKFGMQQLISNGVQAEYLRSTFPTHSWPNWLSLATGLYTENHGMTADYMWDKKTKLSFERGKGANDSEDIWWEGLPAPLWYTAGKSGIDVHCYWFAHCHRAHYDMVVKVPPKRWTDLSTPGQTDKLSDVFPEIVNRIIKYQAYKQQMFLLRYAGVDNALRQFGARSDEADQAIARIDLYIHELQQKLDEHNLFSSTNLVVLSDHGLAQIEEEEQFYLEECLSDYSKVIKVVNLHSMLMVFTEPEDEGHVHFELRVCDQWAPMGDYEDTDTLLVKAHKLSEIPERLHWANSRFMSGVVLLTKPGTSIITRELPSIPSASDQSREAKQTGGWDPETPQMRGIFMARGPAFKVNEKVGPIEIVDIYQTLLNILAVEPAHSHNGTWSNVEGMLASGWEERPNSDRFNDVARIFCSFSVIMLAVRVLY